MHTRSRMPVGVLELELALGISTIFGVKSVNLSSETLPVFSVLLCWAGRVSVQ